MGPGCMGTGPWSAYKGSLDPKIVAGRSFNKTAKAAALDSHSLGTRHSLVWVSSLAGTGSFGMSVVGHFHRLWVAEFSYNMATAFPERGSVRAGAERISLTCNIIMQSRPTYMLCMLNY